MTDAPAPRAVTRSLSRRLVPLQVAVALEGFMLWVPVEKLFQTQIGFTPAAIGLMAAAYAAVVPLLEVPTGILADRWSRKGILMASSVAVAGSALLGGVSHNVATYIAAAMILGVYFALNSGTVDSVVYDTVLEETGSSDLYERHVGRVRAIESGSFALSALLGGVIAGWTTPRMTYLATVPFALIAIAVYLPFREPQLHRTAEPTALGRHIAITVGAMTRLPRVRRVLLVSALTALISSAVFEFGPLWLVDLDAPASAYGPYWALLVGTLGVGAYLSGRLDLDRRLVAIALAVVLAAMPVLLATSHVLPVVALAQTVLALLVAVLGIHIGRLLHDAVPSTIRAGVSSGAGTFSWLLFLPFSLVFGALAKRHGVHWAGWLLVGVAVVLAVLLAVVVARTPRIPAEPDVPDVTRATVLPAPVDVACRELVTVISDYLDGVLPADWRTSVETHLTRCDGCTAYLQQVRTMLDALARLDVEARTGAHREEPA